jgi:hypothetical protein
MTNLQGIHKSSQGRGRGSLSLEGSLHPCAQTPHCIQQCQGPGLGQKLSQASVLGSYLPLIPKEQPETQGSRIETQSRRQLEGQELTSGFWEVWKTRMWPSHGVRKLLGWAPLCSVEN